MRIITRDGLATHTAQRWVNRYGDDKRDIYDKLKSLGARPRADEVDKIIGNGSWTRTVCDECKEVNLDLVEIGEPQDYESNTANICKECLKKALDL